MKCFKCGGIWETNSKFKFCPFCGYQLPEENISNMNGTAKMIKSFVVKEVLKENVLLNGNSQVGK